MKKITKKKEVKVAPEVKNARPSWDEYFNNISEIVGTRATCNRGKSGCVIVRDRRILVTGYVGSPVGMPHCDEYDHELHKVINEDGKESVHCIRTVHAEQNAIAQAAKMGIAINESTLYCHMTPCYICAKILVNSGIRRVVANKDYHASKKSKELFDRANIELVILNNEIEVYKKMK